MSQQELLIGVARHLDGNGIPYMLTGSIASSLYGEPRLTHDVDVIVSMTVESAAGIAQVFPPPRYHLDSPFDRSRSGCTKCSASTSISPTARPGLESWG